MGLSRVVDWTDLAALIVLPFAYRLAVRQPIVWHPALVCVSLFAFAATSVPRASFDLPNDDPLARIETKMPIEAVWRPGPYIDERAVRDELAQHLDACLRK